MSYFIQKTFDSWNSDHANWAIKHFITYFYFRLTTEDLDGIIEEIDEDGSGTMDFDEFCQMMMS